MEPLRRQLYLTFRAVRDRLEEDMGAVDASVPQWVVLTAVGDEPGLSQRQLADRVLVAGSTLTHHLDRMEADGLIARARDAADRRITRVSLTGAGALRRAELDAVVDRHDARLAAALPECEARTLDRLLRALYERIADTEGAPR